MVKSNFFNIKYNIIDDIEYHYQISLIRYVLIKKYYDKTLSAPEKILEYLDKNKNKVDQKKLFNNLRKNKLIKFIGSQEVINKLFPEFRETLVNIRKEEMISFLNYISNAKQISNLLDREKIEFIILKGVALSQLIHNDFFSRSYKDIDIFIDSKDLLKTINLLLDNDYKIQGFDKEIFNNERIFNYIKWVDYSFKFHKKILDRNFEIDLHWDLSYNRKHLPNFYESWSKRSSIILEGTKFNVLSPLNNFIHLCAHSAKDGWMLQRDLIEIYLLAREIPKNKLNDLKKVKFVRNSIYASSQIVNPSNKSFLFTKKIKKAESILKISYLNQVYPNRYIDKNEKNFFIYFKNFYQLIELNMECEDKLRFISHKLIRPSLISRDFKMYSIFFILVERCKRFLKRFL